jgi:hypothetical protein
VHVSFALLRFFSERLQQFRQLVEQQTGASKRSLFVYMVSIRVFPFTPNW